MEESEGQNEKDPVADVKGGSFEGEHGETAMPKWYFSETGSRVA